MLYFTTGTSGWLKIRTGYNLVGTSAANKGRVLANSDGVWGNTGALPFADKAVIDLQGTSQAACTYLSFRMYCYAPTTKAVRTYASKYTVTVSGDTFTGATLSNGTKVNIQSSVAVPAPLVETATFYVVDTSGSTFKLACVSGGTYITLTDAGSGTIEVFTGLAILTSGALNVLEDVSADSAWTTVSGSNSAILANYADDTQSTTITAIAAGTVTTALTTDSEQFPGAPIVLTSRNVRIVSAGTSLTQPIINASVGGVFDCEIRNSNATNYGYAVSGGSANIISGVVVGCNRAVTSSPSSEISGVIANCNTAIYGSAFFTVTGRIIGCDRAADTCTNAVMSGSVENCAYAYDTFGYSVISGSIKRCSYAIYLSSESTLSGQILDCGVVASGDNNIFSGDIVSTITYVNASGASGNVYTGDLSLNATMLPTVSSKPKVTTVYLRNAKLPTALAYTRNTSGERLRIYAENYNRVSGADKVLDNFGDIIRRTCGSGAPVPSTDPDGGTGDCLEVSSITSNCSSVDYICVIEALRVWKAAGTYTFRFKTINTFTSGLASGDVSMTAEYLATGGVITVVTDSTTAMSTASDWSQGIDVTLTSAVAGWVTLGLYLRKYEASALLFVYPVPTVS
jgi:hypothetical protein